MTGDEARFVVVAVDEPTGDAIRAVAADLASVEVEGIHAVDLHPQQALLGGQNLVVRLAEDDKQVPRIILPFATDTLSADVIVQSRLDQIKTDLVLRMRLMHSGEVDRWRRP